MFDADFISGPPNLLYSGVTAATVDIYYMSLCLEQLFLNYEYTKSYLKVFFLLFLLAFHWNLLFAIVPQRPSLYMILLGSHSKLVSRNFFPGLEKGNFSLKIIFINKMCVVWDYRSVYAECIMLTKITINKIYLSQYMFKK